MGFKANSSKDREDWKAKKLMENQQKEIDELKKMVKQLTEGK